MITLICDDDISRQLRKRRKALDIHHHDEVWNGVYIVMPSSNDEHQAIICEFLFIFETLIGQCGLGKIRPGVNVSDRKDHWEKNYRCPDVVVFLNGTTAVNRDAFWFGGPDFAVEVISKGDRSRKKLDFYAKVNVRELLIVDRFPWSLELYRNRDGVMELVGRSTVEESAELGSEVLPVSFQLVPGTDRPVIKVAEQQGEHRWSV